MPGRIARALALLSFLATAIGCASPCALYPPTSQPGDVALGTSAQAPVLVASRPDQRWAVFVREGLLLMVIGGAGEERIDAFLGATEDELGIVRNGQVELISIASGTRRLIAGEPSFTFEDRILRSPSDAHLMPDARLLWIREGRHEAELVDTRNDTRRTFAVEGLIRNAGIDPSGNWLIVEEMAANEWASRRRTFFDLASEQHITVESHGYEARAWGIVNNIADSYAMHTRDGFSQRLEDGCVVHYVGIETSMVIGRCETRGGNHDYRGRTGHRQTYGQSMVWRLGEAAPGPLDDAAIASFAEIDRALLTTPGMREVVHRNGLWHRVTARAPAEVRVYGRNAMQFSDATHTWREVEEEPVRPLPPDVLAWSEDGSALVIRAPSRGGAVCFGTPPPLTYHLVFTHLDRAR